MSDLREVFDAQYVLEELEGDVESAREALAEAVRVALTDGETFRSLAYELDCSVSSLSRLVGNRG